MSGFFRKGTLRRNEGLVLIEVMMAMVLLGFLIVPLATGVESAAGRADMVRNQAARLLDPTGGSGSGDAWRWGAPISSAWWRPGPVLHVRTGARSETDHMVGLWADGWFLGEWEPDGNGVVQVDAPLWTDLAGDELVARVRRAGGVWGPPWRLVVPAADGGSFSLEVAGDSGSGETVAHVPALGRPALGLSWLDVAPEATPQGLPFLLATPGPGPCEIDLDGRKQSWKTESDRGLDVYF